MKLEQIGFYTLSDERAANASETSDLKRCEVVLTSRCNFKCPYCRHVGGDDLAEDQAVSVIKAWARDNLSAIRLSGGEPTLYAGLGRLVELSASLGIGRIAISSNGSVAWRRYKELIDQGVNDFSISLDACCAEVGDKMAGGIKGAWAKVISNIEKISAETYTTVGVVLTEDNLTTVNEIIAFAATLGVHDVRIIPAAQDGDRLRNVQVDESLLEKFPILAYRIRNLQAGRPVRGVSQTDTSKCGLVLDDMAACGGEHYPCIIYMREGGAPIGKIGPNMRSERAAWHAKHDSKCDPICSKNCLDVCVDYNNKHAAFANAKAALRADRELEVAC